MKKNQSPDAPVPLIPCPKSLQNECNGKLRKQDIMLLDKADSTKVGAVALLQRLRNNLRVRCVHHVDHFKFAFGQDAERIFKECGSKCEWTGDLMEYDRHLQSGCPIENKLLEKSDNSQNGSAAPQPAAAPAAPNGTQSAPKAAAPDAKAKASPKASFSPAARMNGSTGAGPGAEPSSPSAKADGIGNTGDVGEVRVAQYDYVPRETDKAQIPLRRHDFVRVFEITDSGWAAGVRLSRETMQEVGDAGWFPEGYLFPLTASGPKKD